MRAPPTGTASLSPLPRAATRAEFDAAVREQRPVVLSLPPAEVTAWAADFDARYRGSGSGASGVARRLPVRLQPPRAVRPPRTYALFYGYLRDALFANYLRRPLTLAEAGACGSPWMVSGIDLRASEGDGGSAMRVLDELMPGGSRTVATGCWLSSRDCATGLHYDAFGPHNFHLLVRGKKCVHLFPHGEGHHLYGLGGLRYATRFVGAVDPSRPDYDRFPAYARATGYEGTLSAGDCLHIPAWWWHSLHHTGDWNVSLTRWFDGRPGEHPPMPPLPSWRMHFNWLRFLILEPLADLAHAVVAAAVGALAAGARAALGAAHGAIAAVLSLARASLRALLRAAMPASKSS